MPAPSIAARSAIGMASIHWRRQDAPRGLRPVNLGNKEAFAGARRFGDLGCSGAFEPQVEFHLDARRERLDERDGFQALSFRARALDLARRKGKGREIARKSLLDVGTQNFDRDRIAAAGQTRTVHLCNRSRGNRLRKLGVDFG